MPPRLCVAPLEVWGPMRDKLLTDKTVVMTSATLMLGGDFNAIATSVGLRPERARGRAGSTERAGGRACRATTRDALPWVGLDVGSPFDYGRQAILYVARHLPPPGRDGLVEAQLAEIASLVDAAEGRTLGLFSSRRAAETAAEAIRERLPHLTTLAQGEAQLPELARQFVGDPHTCLFGTLSLWQGLDVPGETCQLVLIDRIPFPRPDDPLMSARQRAADREGHNGFMQVAATHAALLLAQGAGRLIRTTSDRGVVAVLDPRLATARYGGVPPGEPAADVDDVRRRAGAQGPGPAGAGRTPPEQPVSQKQLAVVAAFRRAVGELVERLAGERLLGHGARARLDRPCGAGDALVELDLAPLDQLPLVGEPRVDQPHRHDHHRPADGDVEDPVVAGADHHDGGDQRVHPGQTTGPVVAGRATDHQRYPQRPAGVQAREGGQLVGQLAHALRRGGVGAPPAVGGVEAQDVGVAAEHPRRSGRQQEVAGQARSRRTPPAPSARGCSAADPSGRARPARTP